MKYSAYKYLFVVMIASFFYPSYGQIVNFDYDRDAEAAKKILENNDNLLTAEIKNMSCEIVSIDIDYLLKSHDFLFHMAGDQDILVPRDENCTMYIKVQKEHDAIVGVCIYVIQKGACGPDILSGSIFLLAVKSEFHGKGYGEKLLSCVMQEIMQVSGIQRVLATAPPGNLYAQEMYQELGFSCAGSDGKTVFYDYPCSGYSCLKALVKSV
jgi:ribosomal protein S18 acetylase RimI-like enzyme